MPGGHGAERIKSTGSLEFPGSTAFMRALLTCTERQADSLKFKSPVGSQASRGRRMEESVAVPNMAISDGKPRMSERVKVQAWSRAKSRGE